MKQKNAITIGTFDGTHLGHQFLLRKLDIFAAKYLLKPLVLYFPVPPKTLLGAHPEMSVLSLPGEKKHYFRQHALTCQTLDFEKIASLSPLDFWQLLCRKFAMGGLLVGPDFAFGKDRSGSIDFLRQQCAYLNIPLEVLPFEKTGATKISSSLIRKLLAQGNIAQATSLLGRPYELTGLVIKGKQLGRKLGFPTANLDTGIYKILPLGVFAVTVRVGKKFYKGFCNIGFRPTVNTLHTLLPLVEVHIFDFKQSIYGRKITIWFIEKLRNETKFSDVNSLQRQLQKDKQAAQDILKEIPLP